MRIAILSDIHDNVWKLDSALHSVRDADVMLCCGDLCSPFIVHQLGRGFRGPIHIVFGNNDGDLYRISSNARQYGQIRLHGELFRDEFDGRRFAMNHYDSIARSLARSGEFDVVCFGHNHVFSVELIGKTLAINPGAIMGATFAPDGTRTDVSSTFVIYETFTGEAARFEA
ncbi:MAG TPA: metallophosphoesterase family protein [Bryobacteraceae bacterium]|nr:metallophosphoesterase family protein [Bryobacteraceae bacterium]